MNKNFIPTGYSKSIYEIDLDVLVSLGVKTILIDLDNTIVPYIQKEPSEKAKEFKTNLDKIGFSLLICSNNKGKRVSHFANLLGVSFFHSLRKPFASRLLKALKQSNINKNECIFIGDQLITDILCANKAGIKSILTEPLHKKEPIWTKINRMFDKPIRRKLISKGLLKPISK